VRFGTLDSWSTFAIAEHQSDFGFGDAACGNAIASASKLEPRPLKSTPMRLVITEKS